MPFVCGQLPICWSCRWVSGWAVLAGKLTVITWVEVNLDKETKTKTKRWSPVKRTSCTSWAWSCCSGQAIGRKGSDFKIQGEKLIRNITHPLLLGVVELKGALIRLWGRRLKRIIRQYASLSVLLQSSHPDLWLSPKWQKHSKPQAQPQPDFCILYLLVFFFLVFTEMLWGK